MTSLRILLTNLMLSSRTGTELVVRDLALGLKARGHYPVVYSPSLGQMAREIASGGIPVIHDLSRVGHPPDIIHGHHATPTEQALDRFPQIPGLFVCHDGLSDHDEPPRTSRLMRYVAVDLNCRERLAAAGTPEARIRVIYNAVDLARFQSRSRLPDRPRRALIFSNYAAAKTHLEPVQEACRQAGLALDVYGVKVGKPCSHPERLLGQYDLVFAKARCAIESMAVGTAVILCDTRGVGSLVTTAGFDECRRWNFGMRMLSKPVRPDVLYTEISRYDAMDATEVSCRIRATADLDGALDQWVGLYQEVLDEWRTQKAAGVC